MNISLSYVRNYNSHTKPHGLSKIAHLFFLTNKNLQKYNIFIYTHHKILINNMYNYYVYSPSHKEAICAKESLKSCA